MFWALIRKDLVRRWRSPASTLVMLAFPFMMAGLIGSVSGGSGGEPEFTLKVFLLDREDGVLGGFLSGASQQRDDGANLEIVPVGEEGFARMEKGEASAMLIIPERFTDRLLDGEDVSLQLVLNPAESIKPEIARQGAEVIATYLDVLVKSAGDRLDHLRDLIDADEMPPLVVVTAITGEIYAEMVRAEPILFPPVVRVVRDKAAGEKAEQANVFGYILVMVSVMSVIFVAIRAVSDLYEDQRTGMLRRQLATPLSVSRLVAAKCVFAALFGAVVMAILLVAGAFFGWFGSGVPVASVLLHAVAFSMSAAGLITVVVALVRTEKQAGILSWVLVMVMSALGGSMFPLEMIPPAIQQFSRFTLNYWAIEGFLDLMVRGRGAAAALPATALLAGVGLALLIIGQHLMKRRLREALR
jgi:ABC-2 type transport system permease protein